jgi:hypothetical protein
VFLEVCRLLGRLGHELTIKHGHQKTLKPVPCSLLYVACYTYLCFCFLVPQKMSESKVNFAEMSASVTVVS